MPNLKLFDKLLRLAAFAGLTAASTLQAAHPAKIARDIPKNGMVDVIVQFTTEPTNGHHSRIAGRGGAMKAVLGSAKAGLYSIPAEALEALSDDPEIRYVSPDRPLKPTLEYATPTVGGAIARSYGWDGKGIGIAIIDSGMSDDTDLKDPLQARLELCIRKGSTRRVKSSTCTGTGLPSPRRRVATVQVPEASTPA